MWDCLGFFWLFLNFVHAFVATYPYVRYIVCSCFNDLQEKIFFVFEFIKKNGTSRTLVAILLTCLQLIWRREAGRETKQNETKREKRAEKQKNGAEVMDDGKKCLD